MAKPKGQKPDKPYPEFPLFPHAVGQWAKKIRGCTHYFGPWRDPDGSMEKYRRQVDDLQAGRVPRDRPADGPGLRDLCNAFLTSKTHRLQTGELSQRTFTDYKRTTDTLIAHFGRDRLLSDITPVDFQKLRSWYAAGDDGKSRGLVAIGNFVRMARIVFKYAFDADLIDKPIKFGPDFTLPSRKALDQSKAARPQKLYSADEIRRMIAVANPQMRAAILLGINAGYGPTDLSRLPEAAVDLKGGWLTFPRPKTQAPRRAKLWRETMQALREVISSRPVPKSDDLVGLVFLTRYGRRVVRTMDSGVHIDTIGLMFGRLLTELGIKRDGVGFYALRHTFRTVADTTMDQPGADLIMGHARRSGDMSAVYREHIDDSRLQRIADHVHAWLFPPKKPRVAKVTTRTSGQPTAKRKAGSRRAAE